MDFDTSVRKMSAWKTVFANPVTFIEVLSLTMVTISCIKKLATA